MVVINHNSSTAIVVSRKENGCYVLVPMSSGSLSAVQVTKRDFERDWKELNYPLSKAVERFLAHAKVHGATQAAMHGLERASQGQQGNLFWA